jgi:adenosylmethionine-8-amino-7-oxononanoate aminotransferase
MNSLGKLDQAHVWHPFTQMRDWMRRDPTVIVRGRGAEIEDEQGNRYLDANASIWTNVHGHRHPRINAAIREQLGKIAHSSALGLANEPATLLAARLVRVANAAPAGGNRLDPFLPKVFFSDDGSTALEVALKLSYEYTRRAKGVRRPRFLALEGAYHGDTVGAVSLGHIDLFHRAYGGLLFRSDKVMAPYCYRCPFNRARPERQDARRYRVCSWECVSKVEQKLERASSRGRAYSAFAFEPLMQGAAGMVPQPPGWLGRVAELARGHGALLVADEVMTGFGRTGAGLGRTPSLFASHSEGVQPDFLCLAKGLTGGYVPMAATLTTQAVFDAFLGEYEEFRTFFHGHSFTGNQIAAAAANASLELLDGADSIRQRRMIERTLESSLQTLWDLPLVGDVRQVGLVVGVELVRDWQTRRPFELRERVGLRVCEAMARRGVMTRPVGSVVVLIPPYCMSERQVRRMVDVLHEAIAEVGKETGRP